MSKGISIHIGLNYVNPSAYGGWDGELAGCINDARDMKTIADSLGYTSTIVTDSQATAAEVCRLIGQAARQLVSGDICLVTYSGHGGQMSDVTGDEPDGKDETWVLWDRQLLDDELNGLWSSFPAGVRILVISDSCNSGTVIKILSFQRKFRSAEMAAEYELRPNQAPRVRLGNPSALWQNYEANRANYEVSQWSSKPIVQASVTLISGCQDNQFSADGDENGLFTQRLLEVWNGGSFRGSYAQFHSAIVSHMPSDQTPNLFKTGAANAAFDAEMPFTIGGGHTNSTGGPSITAPASFPNGASPLTFSVTVPTGRYYAVEVASDASLFDNQSNGSRRTSSNFYGSWQVRPFLSASSYPASFALPSDAWNRLRQNASRLYYRVWCTESSSEWVNAQVSTSDGAASSAPSVTLEASQQPSGVSPSIVAPGTVPSGGSPPRFQANPGPNRYYAVEVATNPWYFNNSQYGNLRNDDNFYASWKVLPFLSSALYPSSFDLPADTWNRLRANATYGRLFYRMWWTDAPDRWVNSGCTTPDSDGQNAPAISLSRDM
ncbi:MAG: caspase family protein [Gammaproteobacteria bacterium]|nr:caspase family protein [Gammaproteobacteria bacterium]